VRVEFDFAGDIPVVDFVPSPLVSNVGPSPTSLKLVFPCGNGPWMLGTIKVQQPVSTKPTSWGRTKSEYGPAR
jgi:hypothetical protein